MESLSFVEEQNKNGEAIDRSPHVTFFDTLEPCNPSSFNIHEGQQVDGAAEDCQPQRRLSEGRKSGSSRSSSRRSNKKEVVRRSSSTASRHQGIYFVEDFQIKLAQSIMAEDTVRFRIILEEYTICCRMGSVIERSSDVVFFDEPNNVIISENANPFFLWNERFILDRVVESSTKYTLMHLAVLSCIPEFVHICLEFGSAVHSHEDINGMTALTLAFLLQPEMVFEMIRLGKNVDITRIDIDGRNLLFHSVTLVAETPEWPQRLDFIKTMVAHDSLLASSQDSFGFTPATWALEHAKYYTSKDECYEIVDFLKNADEENKRQGLVKQKYVIEEAALENENLVKSDDEIPKTVHSERYVSDLVRLYLQGPAARLCCIALLFILHIIVYSSEEADRGLEMQYRDARWDFWFTIYNMIVSSWSSISFYMRITRAACFIFGAFAGAFIYFFGVHTLLGRFILRLPMCGAQSTAERRFMKKTLGSVYTQFYGSSSRGMCFALLLGGLLGVYGGSQLYNTLLYSFWPGSVLWALIRPTIKGIDAVTALRGFWVASLVLDWYIFMFVCDIMYQQGSFNIYLPHYTFGSFAAKINLFLRNWNKCFVEKDISVLRLRLYWAFLFFGLAVIAIVFIFLEYFQQPARLLFVNPLFSIGSFHLPVFFSSFCIFLECVILCQEWTWPTLQEHPFLNFPGFLISSHHVWFFMLLILFEISLDMRIIIAYIRPMRETASVAVASQKGVVLSMLLIPALLGCLLLAVTIIRSSLWWERCGLVGRAVQLYNEHLYLDSAPLPAEAALISKSATEDLALQLSRQLVCKTNISRAKIRQRNRAKFLKSRASSRKA